MFVHTRCHHSSLSPSILHASHPQTWTVPSPLHALFAAALLLGAESAAGTDTDPLAVRAAAANAELNGVQEKLTLVRCGPSLDDPDPMQEVRCEAVSSLSFLSKHLNQTLAADY